MLSARDTIVALATPPGVGGVCIIRLSGKDALAIAQKMGIQVPKPRLATLSYFRNLAGDVIDQGIVLYFPSPHSYTGEDVVELQGHGGIAVAQELLETCMQAGARHANAGEFTERAFLNDRLDLAQAEAVLDLIHARSKDAVYAANRSLQGYFSKEVHALAEDILHLRMYIEASLDFSDEEIDLMSLDELQTKLNAWGMRLLDLLKQTREGQLINEGAHLVLLGKPNVGKSSLLNALLGEDRAIVTAQAGTTRDIIKDQLLIEGIPIHILDTAGLRESDNLIEQEGIRRSRLAAEKADVLLLVLDGENPVFDESDLPQTGEEQKILTIYNKADLVAENARAQGLWISAKTGEGLPELKREIAHLLGKEERHQAQFIARARHVEALKKCYQLYEECTLQLSQHQALELLAEDLRRLHDTLGEITGKVSSDELLGEIFSGFCIGK